MKETKLKATLCLCDTPAASGRKYDMASMKNALENYKESLNAPNMALGELAPAHSTNPIFNSDLLCDNLATNLTNASHIVESVSMDSNGKVTGEIKLLNTQAGKLVADMIRDGVKLYMQPRTLGIAEGDTYKVDTIVSFDITPTPPFGGNGNELRPLE